MRWTQTLIPTMKEEPADAEVPSHRLMLRAGLVRQLMAGAYTYLPLGYRALRRVAAERGWPVLTFVKPVPLLRRLTIRGRGLLTVGMIVSATALLAGAATYSALRRRRWIGAGHQRESARKWGLADPGNRG